MGVAVHNEVKLIAACQRLYHMLFVHDHDLHSRQFQNIRLCKYTALRQFLEQYALAIVVAVYAGAGGHGA